MSGLPKNRHFLKPGKFVWCDGQSYVSLILCGQILIIYKMFQSGIEIDVAFLRLRQTDSMTVKLVNGGRRPLGGLQVVGRT